MPRSTAWAAGREVVRQSWRWNFFPAALAVIAVATMAGGVLLLVLHARAAQVQHVLAPAGIVLLISSFVQWRAAWTRWHDAPPSKENPLRRWVFWRRLFSGAFLAYLVALAIGPVPHIEYGILAAVVAWFTLLLLPLAASPRVVDRWRTWMRDRAPRRLGRYVFASILALIAAEAGLQSWKLVRQNGWLPVGWGGITREGHLPAAHAALGPSPRRPTEPLRVAILSDVPAERRGQQSGYMDRVEQALPGVEIVSIDLPAGWSSRPLAELADELSRSRPDLVLAMLSVCEDVTRDVCERSWFDWRQYELARCVVARPREAAGVASGSAAAASDFESLCRSLAPQLAACRTPIDPAMHARWQQTFEALDDLVAGCRRRDLPVAVVLVPGEFQVNRALCDTLARRGGYTSEQLDVELPQRKLFCFAAKRKLPVIDLLPSLRLCGESPYQRNATSWNHAGHVAAATAIGGWLESRYGRQQGVSAQLTSAP